MVRYQLLQVLVGVLLLATSTQSTTAAYAQQNRISLSRPWTPYQMHEADDSLNGASGSPPGCKLRTGNSFQLHEGFGADPSAGYLPSNGQLKAQMIFVDFHDAAASESTEDLYRLFMPGASDWYRNSSYGRLHLNVTPDLSKFYRMPKNSSDYVWHRGMGYKEHSNYVQDALDAVGSSISFAGMHLLYVVPTKDAAAISYSPTFMAPIEAPDGTLILKTVTFGQDVYDFGYKLMNHETGHTMGLPDLYSFEPQTNAGIFVGGYDLMAEIGGISPDYLAWHKWQLGWIDDDQISCLNATALKSGRVRRILKPIEEAGGLKAVIVRYNATFAIVAENRSGRYLNTNTCGTGVLIYTVSTLTASGSGPIRVQDPTPDSGCAGSKLNDALFVPGHGTRSTLTGFGYNITVVRQSGRDFTVEVSNT